MFKILIIFCLALYILFKISSFFFRAGAASQQFRSQPRPDQSTQAKNKKQKNFKEGEYIDYEEIK